MEEKILSLLLDMQADIKGIKGEIVTINQRLDNLESGQKALEAGQKALEAGQKALEAGQESIKRCIKENNVAIGELITEAMESHEQKCPRRNSNVYRLMPVE